jgi:hypothetical protein
VRSFASTGNISLAIGSTRVRSGEPVPAERGAKRLVDRERAPYSRHAECPLPAPLVPAGAFVYAVGGGSPTTLRLRAGNSTRRQRLLLHSRRGRVRGVHCLDAREPGGIVACRARPRCTRSPSFQKPERAGALLYRPQGYGSPPDFFEKLAAAEALLTLKVVNSTLQRKWQGDAR